MLLLPAGPAGCAVAAPAKLNLHLEVTGKRPDGYHGLETLMLAVDLFDTLEVQDDPAGGLTLGCDTPGVPDGPANLAWRAADELRTRLAPDRGARLRLTKRIPHQAGLGGGSSDAAAAILGCARVWGVEPSAEAAAAVGSDVAFFLGGPAAWCTGRGEVVEPEAIGGELNFVIVKPPGGLATADVYRRLTVPAEPASGREMRRAVRAGDPGAVARHLFNRLEGPAFGLRPDLAELAETVRGCGPLGVRLTGSGSAVFAVCRDSSHALQVAGRVRLVRGECSVYAVRGGGLATGA
jgi:4-diphosphocytidyl-2-C-methyl-D-erythritol kinase